MKTMPALILPCRHFPPGALGLSLLLAPLPAFAADYYWDSNGDATLNNISGTDLGGAGTITTAGINWWDGVNSPDLATSALPAATTLVFNGTGGAVTVTSGTNIANITGVRVTSSGYSFTNTVAFGLSSINNFTLDDSSSSSISLTNAPSWAGGTRTVTVGENDILTITNLITGTGGATLTKNGSGTLNYTSTSTTNSRPVNVNAGTLNFSGLSALFGGGTNNTSITGTLNATNNIDNTLNATGGFALSPGAALGADAARTFTLGNNISGNGGLLKVNAGTVTLTSDRSTYTGATSVRAGILSVTDDVTGNGTAPATTAIGGINATTDTVTSTAINVADGEAVYFSGTGGATGIATATRYYAKNTGANTFQLYSDRALTTLIDITANNTATANVLRSTSLGRNGTAIALGDASTAGSDTPSFLTTGSDTQGVIIRRALTVNNFGSTISIGGDSNINSVFTNSITLNKGVTLTSAATGGNTVDFQGAITGGFGVTKAGAGKVSLTSDKVYSGTTDINAGNLEISGSTGSISATSSVSINGGTLLLTGGTNRINNSAGITTTSGRIELAGNVNLSESVDKLTLGSGSSVFDFGAGTGTKVFTFANSSSLSSTWTSNAGTLQVWSWNGTLAGGGNDQLMFGAAGLTNDQVGQISFLNPAGLPAGTYAANLLGTGELVPVPEPAVLTSSLVLLGALLRRRR